MAAPAPSPPPQRQWVGTLRAQITGRRHYKGAAAPLGARYTLSRSNSAAQECRKYDANATVVLNSSGETVGSLAKAFAACVAPVLDGALAALECTVPLQQRAGGSMRLQYNPGEQLDLDVAFFASAAELPALQALGVLARLDRASAGGGGGGGAAAAAAAAPPPPPSSAPAAKRAGSPRQAAARAATPTCATWLEACSRAPLPWAAAKWSSRAAFATQTRGWRARWTSCPTGRRRWSSTARTPPLQTLRCSAGASRDCSPQRASAPGLASAQLPHLYAPPAIGAWPHQRRRESRPLT
jgi:hypothetical protein